MPLAALAGKLAGTRQRLDALVGDDPHTDLRAVFSWSYQALTPEAARLFRLLGLHPGPDIAAPTAASLAGQPLSEVQLLLTELTRASLLAEHSVGRFTSHDLLRAYAADLADGLGLNDRRAAVERMLTHYLRTARVADQFLDPNWEALGDQPSVSGVIDQPVASHQEAMAWFFAERPNLLEAVRLAVQHTFDTYAYQLVWSLTTFLFRSGDWRGWAEAGQAALAATQRIGDRRAEARAHRILASAHIRLRRYPDAHTHYQRALALFTEFGDLTGQAHTHLMLGRLFGWQAVQEQALEHAQRALILYRDLGDQAWQARALNDIGRTYGKLGNHQEGLIHCQKALKLCADPGDRDGEATTLASLAELFHQSGQLDRAISHYQRSADIRVELGDRYDEAETLTSLAAALEVNGEHPAAQSARTRAAAIRDQIKERGATQIPRP
ncbi:tetratricopeptide repeat protein [Plantactinospora sp. KLBMP9567]|uniref:tetratricopeptide repeat protein n=1 Tax=Plantactinospora sp. KLBMP9567 TaxID=3085900 RepID=UPI002980BCD1|nr:tetratricopeptide repeat protein [Plantactinospora sp. KLBMP9567]MDW5327182.1 tetratricopeptide repeat protein [Plantactinospora sp. KLBMP9567]